MAAIPGDPRNDFACARTRASILLPRSKARPMRPTFLLLVAALCGCTDGAAREADVDTDEPLADTEFETDDADASRDPQESDSADTEPSDGSDDAVDTPPEEDVEPGDTPDENADATADPLSWPLDTEGPYRVGYRRFEWTYEAAWLIQPRTIGVNLWYPTLDTEGTGTAYIGLFPDTAVFVDASLAPSPYGDTYPVHLHSHGSQGHGGTSAFMMRHFASHGWVCVAPDHVGNLLNDDLSPRPIATYLNRPRDLSEALNAVESVPAGDPLHGKADTSRVLLSGHSFGVYTVWAAIGADYHDATVRRRCASGDLGPVPCTDAEIAGMLAGLGDDRIVAAIGMAGSVRRSFFGPLGHRSVRVPFFAMTGTADPVEAEAQFETTSGVDLTWIAIEGGCHQTFALGGCPTMPNARGWRILDTYALAFARRHVLGVDEPTGAALLDGTTIYDEVVDYRHHPADPGPDAERWGEPPSFAGTQTVDDTLEGVRIVSRQTSAPRPLRYHVVQIDPGAPGIDFTVTPANGELPRETTRQTTRAFVDQTGVTLGINAHFFSPWPPEDGYAEVIGLSASDGEVYSGFDADYDVGIALLADGTPVFVEEGEGEGIVTVPEVAIDDAVGAREAIVRGGVNTASWNELHPRTAIGIDGSSRLVLVVVDGRQDGVSEGMTTPELAEVMLEFGVVDAINLDGGGSSTLVVADPQGRVRNVPVGFGLPGTERDNGSNFGVYAEARRFALE